MLTGLGVGAALAVGCEGPVGPEGPRGEPGEPGPPGADGEEGADAGERPLPALEGHTGDRPLLLPYTVQAAYNDDTFFWRVSYPGNEGVRHDYWRYTGGAWRKEGGDRRDAQATIDGDEAQGSTSVRSTIYEQRTSLMLHDPAAAGAVRGFDRYGCFLTCHDTSRHMPRWAHDHGEDTKYVALADTAATAGTPVLDLWHWRGARSGPIDMADDQNVLALDVVDATAEDDGGRKGDAGEGPFVSNELDLLGNPTWVLDPTSTLGLYAFSWTDFWSTPYASFTDATAQARGDLAPHALAMAWETAAGLGYAPTEGDTVPARLLRAGSGSRADITAYGSAFVRTSEPDLGVWHVQMQRRLVTGNADDVALAEGGVYDVAFEVHLWEYTTRDHYVSFPLTLGLGAATEADVRAVRVEGAGALPLPDFEDVARFPPVTVPLFQPGIATWEFLTGATAASGDAFYDAAAGGDVDQVHGGAAAVAEGTTACEGCHPVRAAEGDASMETLAPLRGGVFATTPHVE